MISYKFCPPKCDASISMAGGKIMSFSTWVCSLRSSRNSLSWHINSI